MVEVSTIFIHITTCVSRDAETEYENHNNLQGSHRQRAPSSPLPTSGFPRSTRQWDTADDAQSAWHYQEELDEVDIM